jgi:hypothetical protein
VHRATDQAPGTRLAPGGDRVTRPLSLDEVHALWVARAERVGLHPGDPADTRLAAFTAAHGNEVGPFAPELVPRILAAREWLARSERRAWGIATTKDGVPLLVPDLEGRKDNFDETVRDFRARAERRRKQRIVKDLRDAADDGATADQVAIRWGVSRRVLFYWADQCND